MTSTQLKNTIFSVFAFTASLALGAGANGSSNAAPIRGCSTAQHHSIVQVPLRPDDEVIYDNGGPTDFHDALEICAWIFADDFFVTSDSTLTSVFFWDLELPGAYRGEIAWALYSDAGGYPGAVLTTGAASGAQVNRTFLQGGIDGRFDEYSNSFNISP